MGELRLEELSARNIVAANSLSLKPGQEQFIAPVSYAVAASVINPATAWQRVVLLDGEVAGFIHGNFDPDSPHEEFRACIWRINVDAEAQGKGVGKFAADALAAEARKRGFDHITVIWEPGEEGPESFFHRLGFSDIGQTVYGEIIGALQL
ncbi:GNAT family N-acetyltransferase [Cryobacterium sp. TMT1-62]|uniref:GNAT family N-acetyltransferase n=1 Tax=Cryobacterium sandaracinum TaxID=1259247 RepID=A0ABY2JEF0_9MICO|nr:MULTISPECIES: GNAT family N-acetyltransferase [Cryobacterium]TFB60078.1 GNAT family N-acetyltransferase [Cryobacterium sp. Sr3]TFB66047.1 GNAT family N-acetyltransferase [Cryobacterium sp. Hz7]TFC39671.1 GNAT family N-acetyltransferase [Cryobacterium sp. TMT2-14]TFC55330.1 GNAT family N-acetyltransferase [Cryobacterium sp. TMT2-17-1]TFC67618.1 GNAT family N-acetyltransferase [Cryobacterium sp. TMT2-4]